MPRRCWQAGDCGSGERFLQPDQAFRELFDLLAKGVEVGFKLIHGSGGGGLVGSCGDGSGTAEKVGVARLAGAGLAGELEGEGGGFGGIGARRAGGQAFQGGLDGGEVVELVEAVGAGAELTGSLGSAEEQEAEQRGLVAAEVQDGAGTVLVLGDAGVAGGGDEGELFEREKGFADVGLGEVEDGVAAGALVAGVEQGVEREGVLIRSGDLLLNEGSEDAELGDVKRYAKGKAGVRGLVGLVHGAIPPLGSSCLDTGCRQ
jgi:hypothetical protein